MKKPDSWKHESWLRRILDADRFDSIVYFEEAVLADSNTLMAKGYFLFLITDSTFHFLQSQKDTGLNSANSWSLTDFHSVTHLNDAAVFFGDSVIANHTRHIRIQISDQIASAVSQLDLYAFYEDSALYHQLFQAWNHAHTRAALPVFYPLERNKLNKLSKLGVQALYNHLEGQLLAAGRDEEEEAAAQAAAAAAVAAVSGAAAAATSAASSSAGADNPTTPLKPRQGDESAAQDEQKGAGALAGESDAASNAADAARARAAAARLRAKRRRAADHDYWDVRLKTRLLEEMSLAAACHRSFKSLAFESPSLIPFLLGELRGLGRLRMYMLGADPSQIWSLVSSRADMLVEDESDSLRYAIALWGFLSRILAGSECIASRTKLLAWNSTSKEEELKGVMDDIFLMGGIQLPGEKGRTMGGAGREPPTPAAAAASPSSAARDNPHLVSPTQFLEALDTHIDAQSKGRTGSSGRFVDEEEKRYTQQHLYNLRAVRRWKENVLAAHQDALSKEASMASTADTRKRLSLQVSGLHLRDVPRIVNAAREENNALHLRRGPSLRARGAAAAARDAALFDAPRSADEVGYESVLVSNESSERQGLAILSSLIPELEVAYLEIMYHFQSLLEHVLEARVPFLTFNLDNLFRHFLDAPLQFEFKSLQLPVFARGLVFLCQKERRAVISYYTFVYASVISKLMIRSSELQLMLEDAHYLSLLTGPIKASSGGPQLALLTDITANPNNASQARGLHFYQRTKPLLQSMMMLMINK